MNTRDDYHKPGILTAVEATILGAMIIAFGIVMLLISKADRYQAACLLSPECVQKLGQMP